MASKVAVKIRKPYDRSERSQLVCEDPGRAKQAFKAECDINTILAKYKNTGLIDHVNRYQGQYADVTGESDYQTALNIIEDAREAFMSIPAGIRRDFDNDPHEFLMFAQDPENAEAMVDYGLAHRPKGEDPEPLKADEPTVDGSAAEGSDPDPAT